MIAERRQLRADGVEDMVVLDLAGNRWRGPCGPSDTATHLVLYRAYPELGGVVYTHSTHATAWAQAGAIPISVAPPRPTTFTARSCSRLPTPGEVGVPSRLTGHLIVETLKQTPSSHAGGAGGQPRPPSAGARSADDAVHNAVVQGGGLHGLLPTGPDQPGGPPCPITCWRSTTSASMANTPITARQKP